MRRFEAVALELRRKIGDDVIQPWCLPWRSVIELFSM
jgi:hypothetical protein